METGDHDDPPFDVLYIFAALFEKTVANALFASSASTAFTVPVPSAPPPADLQVEPPFVVRNTPPFMPPVQTTLLSTAFTARSVSAVPLV